ncbi:hypothetical protein ACQKE8_13005 [Sphingobium limneticum]|uniref:hypothetical protein n=1 Tax=Sphingobium limneticum TaxID=1007511 RepID=UPI003D033A51
MANIQRGEASFVHEGVTYHLVMDMNAFAEAEDAADMGVDDLLQALSPKIDEKGNITSKPRLKHLGAMLFGALRARHPNLRHADAIRLLDSKDAGEAIGKALTASMPKPDPSAEGKAAAVPGIGTKPKKTGRQKG